MQLNPKRSFIPRDKPKYFVISVAAWSALGGAVLIMILMKLLSHLMPVVAGLVSLLLVPVALVSIVVAPVSWIAYLYRKGRGHYRNVDQKTWDEQIW